MGIERERPNAEQIAKRIKQSIVDHAGERLKCSIGIAPNAFLAKLATDLQKPDGLRRARSIRARTEAERSEDHRVRRDQQEEWKLDFSLQESSRQMICLPPQGRNSVRHLAQSSGSAGGTCFEAMTSKCRPTIGNRWVTRMFWRPNSEQNRAVEKYCSDSRRKLARDSALPASGPPRCLSMSVAKEAGRRARRFLQLRTR